jgi:hypothetical protein
VYEVGGDAAKGCGPELWALVGRLGGLKTAGGLPNGLPWKTAVYGDECPEEIVGLPFEAAPSPITLWRPGLSEKDGGGGSTGSGLSRLLCRGEYDCSC